MKKLCVLMVLGTGMSALAAPPGGALKYRVEGALPAADVKKVVSQNKHEIAACYSDALNATPGLSGTLALRWTIDAKGVVTAVTSLAPSMGQPLEKCATRVVSKWRFDAPKDGGSVVVTYPFVLAARTEQVNLR